MSHTLYCLCKWLCRTRPPPPTPAIDGYPGRPVDSNNALCDGQTTRWETLARAGTEPPETPLAAPPSRRPVRWPGLVRLGSKARLVITVSRLERDSGGTRDGLGIAGRRTSWRGRYARISLRLSVSPVAVARGGPEVRLRLMSAGLSSSAASPSHLRVGKATVTPCASVPGPTRAPPCTRALAPFIGKAR